MKCRPFQGDGADVLALSLGLVACLLFTVGRVPTVNGEPVDRHDEEIKAIIAGLGARDYDVRERAQRDLEDIAPLRLSEIRAYTNSPDPEIRFRVRAAVKHVEQKIRQRLESAADDSKRVKT